MLISRPDTLHQAAAAAIISALPPPKFSAPEPRICRGGQERRQVGAVALKAGATDNGTPGLRRPNYYAAFVLYPDGNNIEAVFRGD